MGAVWRIVQKVLNESDVVIEVLDARFPEETRNRDVECRVLEQNEP